MVASSWLTRVLAFRTGWTKQEAEEGRRSTAGTGE